MKNKSRSAFLMVAVFLFAPLAVLGCATGHQHQNAWKMSAVNVEILPGNDDKVEIKKVAAYHDGNELLVTGEARQNGPLFSTYRGHIDIAVVQPGNDAVLGTADYEHHPSRQILSAFDVHFPVPPEKGTKVYIIFHPVNETGSEHPAAVDTLLAESGASHPSAQSRAAGS